MSGPPSSSRSTREPPPSGSPREPPPSGSTREPPPSGSPRELSTRTSGPSSGNNTGTMSKHPYLDGNLDQSYNNNLSPGAGNQHVVSSATAPGNRHGAKSKTGQDYLVTVNIITSKWNEDKSFTADFLKMRKWAHISRSKKILEMVLNPSPLVSVAHYGSNQLCIEISAPPEMTKGQLSALGSEFIKAVEKLDFLQIELQASEDVQRLPEELDRMGQSFETMDFFLLPTHPSSLVIQGPLGDFFPLLSKVKLIDSMDMIDPYTKAKLNYFALEMHENAWKLVEYLDSFENAQRKFKSVHLFKENKTIWGIGEEKVVEEARRYFSENLYLKKLKHATLKDIPEQVLKFMKGKYIQEYINEKVKTHGFLEIYQHDGKHVLKICSKSDNNLKIIEGLVRRHILWKNYPIQKNAGIRLEQLQTKMQRTNPKDAEKISAEFASAPNSENLSVILIYTTDIIEDPQLKDFMKELEHVQYEEKSLKLPFHSYLEEVCKKDITEMAKNCKVELYFSKDSREIHLKGPIAGISFVEDYLTTFSTNHRIIPVPDLESMKQKVDNLKRRSPIFVQMCQEKKAKMWITQKRSMILYCGQLNMEFFDRQVSVIPELTENKELLKEKGNIQWEEVEHSLVHLRFPKWQDGDHKDKHFMRDTLEEMIKQLRSYEKTSVLFPMHEFPTWPVQRLTKSIISSTENLNGHLKIILIYPDMEKYDAVVKTISVSLKDATTTDVCIFDVWGEESVLKICSMELERTSTEEMQTAPTSGKVKQDALREPTDQTMSFRDTTVIENEDKESPLSPGDMRQEKEENGYLAENEETRACIVVKFGNREAVEENISELTKTVKPRAVICPYEKENMALVVFENTKDAAKVMEHHKKFLEKEMTLEFLPKQAVVGVHAQISSAFLEKFQNKTELCTGVQRSSGVKVKKIHGEKWILTGSLPQIQLAHKYLQNEFAKMKSAGHSLKLTKEETKEMSHENTSENLSGNPKRSLRSSTKTGKGGSHYTTKTESSTNDERAHLNKDSKPRDAVVQIPMQEFSYHSLFYFRDNWLKDCDCNITYGNGNIILTGNRENTEKLADELKATLAEIDMDKMQTDLKHKDTVRKFENMRDQQEVYVKYFENPSKCGLEFAGFSNAKIKEIKEHVSNAIKKEEKALEVGQPTAAKSGPSVNKNDPQNIQMLFTNEGLKIQVYKGDITSLNVDCIVSSNTNKLSNVSGVAKAIANAAGQSFQEECKKYIKDFQELQKGFCCTTGAGNLPYRYVIHVAGPIWERGRNSTVEAVLKMSMFSIMKEADRLRLRSVAIPAISAGQKNANKSLCTRVYAEAVCLYSAEQQQTKLHLEEVHFVDREDAMVELITKGFKEHLEKITVDLPKAGYQPSVASCASSELEVFKPHYQKRKLRGKFVEEFNLTKFIKVTMWKGDILKSPFEYAICCGQDSDFKSDSNIAKTFKSRQGVKPQISEIKRIQKHFGVGEVFVVPSKECMIYFVVIKSFTKKNNVTVASFLSDITHCVEMVLSKAEASKERAIAVPLLGTGNAGAPKQSAAAKAWFDGVLAFLRKSYNQQEHHLREIYFVSNHEEDIDNLSSLMRSRIENCSHSLHGFVFDSLV